MTDRDTRRMLKTRASDDAGFDEGVHPVDDAVTAPPVDKGVPLMGLFAVGFALMGIFTYGLVFVPLGLLFGVIALFLGQIGLGLLAIVLSIVGVLTSPTLLVMLGLGALGAWFGLGG